VGDIAVAENDVRAMQTEFPDGTLWNDYIGPEIEAPVIMAAHRPKDAIAVLERSRPLEGRDTTILKLRADAYLAAGESALAEKAYREIVGRAWQSPVSEEIPLSWLGLARAFAAQNKRLEAIDAYQHFLTLGAHADPDAIFLKQAKQELAKLQMISPAP
jgi:predicted Zn-dependent protease